MYILLALQLINPYGMGTYVWTDLGTYSTWTACRNAISAVVTSDNSRKWPQENYLCVPTGDEPISVGPYTPK